MSDIPEFKTAEDAAAYSDLFKKKTQNYITMMNIIRDELYKDRSHQYSWSEITGDTLGIIVNITNSVMYDTTSEYRDKVPGYEDPIFIPRKSFKKNVAEAMVEAMKGTMLAEDRDSNFPGEVTILGDK